jgi:GNAT superfamily N-acetyltransferase
VVSRPFIVRSTTEDDWQDVRALRLEMLQDTPIAYLETFEQALARPESHWRERAAGRDGSLKLAAIADDGRWIGTMTGITTREGPTLVAVYVAPGFRGRSAGVTDALLEGIEEWARRSSTTLRLEVNEFNPRARVAYEHRGFVATGRTHPHPLPPPSLELEMIKRL